MLAATAAFGLAPDSQPMTWPHTRLDGIRRHRSQSGTHFLPFAPPPLAERFATFSSSFSASPNFLSAF